MTQHSAGATAAFSVADLTLEEKASLTSGGSFWSTKSVARAGIPEVLLADGPHGLRLQAGSEDNLGLAESLPATCYPPAVGLGSSWDVDLVHAVGAALGAEASIAGVGVVLGPGINIKRSALCGRNFEYFSEDPVVSGALGAASVRGIQSQGVGASVKHFAANNKEDDRLRSSSEVAERPLREIYLRPFHRVVVDAEPWTVMCSYNRINGLYASENPWLLTQVLRDDWGFGGVVVSDWGAVNDRVAGLAAGMDLEMPATGGHTDAEIVAAVRGGFVDESILDRTADRLLELVRKVQAGAGSAAGPFDVKAHHDIARDAAARSIVLLKNDDRMLPLAPNASVAVIGPFAQTPRFQGGGSSKTNPTRMDNAIDAIREHAGESGATFAAGFLVEDDDTDRDAELRAEAVSLAASKDVAVVFLGLTDADESEGYDRTHIDLSSKQLQLLDAVLAVNPRTIVVLSNGSVVALPFKDRVPAIVEAWLLGQAGGSAIADVLYGVVNPSAKLAETIPLRLQDSPAYLDFDVDNGLIRYSEGLFVGYRWYDARGLDVAYPFGHGLSYTSFEYGQPVAAVTASGDVDVRVTVTNTGERTGREVVQVYTSLPGSSVQRPPRELKAFAIAEISPGSSHEFVMTVRRADLAYWNAAAQRWIVEGGEYVFEVGASSRDIRSSIPFALDGDSFEPAITRESTLAEALAHPTAGPALRSVLAMEEAPGGPSMGGADQIAGIMGDFPLGRFARIAGESLKPEVLDPIIDSTRAG